MTFLSDTLVWVLLGFGVLTSIVLLARRLGQKEVESETKNISPEHALKIPTDDEFVDELLDDNGS